MKKILYFVGIYLGIGLALAILNVVRSESKIQWSELFSGFGLMFVLSWPIHLPRILGNTFR